MKELFFFYFLPCFWAFWSCFAFCILFNIHGGGIWLCCAGGAMGWLTYLIAQRLGWGMMAAALVAGVAISAWSEVMARVRKCPVTGYLLVAFFPLVPGGGIYYAMEQAIAGETREFAQTLLRTLGAAGALALGVLLVSSGVRMWRIFGEKRRNHREKQP